MSARAYIPAASANVTTGSWDGSPLACPECAEDAGTLYGRMGVPDSLVCGRCFDNLVFGDDAEARAAAEAHRDEVLRWMYGPGGRAALQEVLAEAKT